MKRPFNIFPSKAYKNDQFQVVSKVDDLQIDIFYGVRLIKSLRAKSDYPVLLTDLGFTGEFMAKCIINGQHFEQEIVVEEALRLGSSEFKKVFLFDDTNYSFFLMQDRLLIYDEEKDVLLTENHYSPTDIIKLSDTKFLFITRLGTGSSGIVNLGIYDLETFSMVGELMNSYSEIAILPESNKAWLIHKDENTIDCFELYHDSDRVFSRLKSYEVSAGFEINASLNRILLYDQEKVRILDLNNLHKSIEVVKSENLAIDLDGNCYYKEGTNVTYQECFSGTKILANIDLTLNISQEGFLYVGQSFKVEFEFNDYSSKVELLNNQIIATIQEGKTYHYHALPDSEWVTENYATHSIYPTRGGIFIFQKTIIKEFKSLTLRKDNDAWTAKQYSNQRNEYSLIFFTSNGKSILFGNTYSVSNINYQNSVFQAIVNNQTKIFIGKEQKTLSNESSYQIIKTGSYLYLLEKVENKYSVFELSYKIKPILKGIEILNEKFIDDHKILWYHIRASYVTNPNLLHAFDLKAGSRIPLDNKKVQESLSDRLSSIQFFDNYAHSSNQTIFNPISPQIKDAVIGKIKEVSKGLNKVLTLRDDLMYLSSFDDNSQSYKLTEIPIQIKKYKESYLAPNGKFLVLQEETDKYLWWDVEKNESVNFFSGKFLAFRNDGNLIIKEQNNHRAVKIIDPETFESISPSNYPYFDLISPDGKLYSRLKKEIKYVNRLTKNEVSSIEIMKYRTDYDTPKHNDPSTLKSLEEVVEANRRNIFNSFKIKFEELEIFEPSEINSEIIIERVFYIQIGIVGNEPCTEIIIPNDTEYYNYSAFSYDNKYLGIVGKPFLASINNSFIGIYELDVNHSLNTINVYEKSISRLPSMACWVCGFSQTGFFATYDSNPDTYLIDINDDHLSDELSDTELRQNLSSSRLDYYSTFKSWRKIAGKNFLCFSPSGNYLALSEQGYEPRTLGGYGHQESSVVHIAETETGKIIKSFADHGFKLVDHDRKDTIFVAFSEDEKRLMTMSKDGVVIVRDINVPEDGSNEELSQGKDLQFLEL